MFLNASQPPPCALDPYKPGPIKLTKARTAGSHTARPLPAPAVRTGPQAAKPAALWHKEPLSHRLFHAAAFVPAGIPLPRAWERAPHTTTVATKSCGQSLGPCHKPEHPRPSKTHPYSPLARACWFTRHYSNTSHPHIL